MAADDEWETVPAAPAAAARTPGAAKPAADEWEPVDAPAAGSHAVDVNAPNVAPAPAVEQGQPSAFASLWDRAKSVGKAAAQPFEDIGHGLMAANRFATQAITHPIDTFGNAATRRELLRGVNSNIPFANRAVEAIGGIPAESPQDQAAATPGASEFGGVAGMPLGNMVGGVAAKGIEAAAPIASSFVQKFSAAAKERQVGRAMEDLQVGARQKSRLGLEANSEDGAAEALLRSDPAVRKAVGHDADLLRATEAVKKQAGEVLDRAYVESPAARSAGSADLQALEQKAKAARARASELASASSGAGPEPPSATGTRYTPSQLRSEFGPGMSTDPTAASWSAHPNATRNPLSLPDATPMSGPDAAATGASWNPRALAADEARAEAEALEKQVAMKRQSSGPSSAPPVTADAPISALDRRISALKATKLPNDAAAASALEKIRDKLSESIGKDGRLDPRKLRQIQSDYQREGYAKNVNDDPEVSARIRANREASKAVGDAVLKHVTGMDYAAAKAFAEAHPDSVAARIFKANEQIEGANRIEATVTDRLKAGKVAEPHGVLGAIKHVAAHAVSHAALPAVVGTMSHSPMAALQAAAIQEGMRYAPAAARGVASAADRATMAMAPRLASGIGKVGATAGAIGDSLIAKRIRDLMARGISQQAAIQMVRSGVAPAAPPMQPSLATETGPDPIVL